MTSETAIEWARSEATRLLATQIRTATETAAAAEFLRIHAGPDSSLFAAANAALMSKGSAAWVAQQVGYALQGWADIAESGIVQTLPWEAAVRVEASTDIMEQVQRLLEDGRVHPAAPVVLAGAALEEFLRSLAESNGLKVRAKPSIDAYAKSLKAAEVITTQDMKDITSWAGLRNGAAHGRFDDVSAEQARIMAAHINLFMRERSPKVRADAS